MPSSSSTRTAAAPVFGYESGITKRAKSSKDESADQAAKNDRASRSVRHLIEIALTNKVIRQRR
jgi:hypothetical protein